MLALAAAAAHAEDPDNAPMLIIEDDSSSPYGTASRVKRAQKKRCGGCAGCTVEVDCNECKYCLDKPKLGGSNTLRRQCIHRVCVNKAAAGSADDTEVSAYTQECLEAAIAHGEATAAIKPAGAPALPFSLEPMALAASGTSLHGLPPPPPGKRMYTKSSPGRPTHSPYQKTVMARYYEFNKLPDAQEREALGKALGLTPRAVQVWFQVRACAPPPPANRRAR